MTTELDQATQRFPELDVLTEYRDIRMEALMLMLDAPLPNSRHEKNLYERRFTTVKKMTTEINRNAKYLALGGHIVYYNPETESNQFQYNQQRKDVLLAFVQHPWNNLVYIIASSPQLSQIVYDLLSLNYKDRWNQEEFVGVLKTNLVNPIVIEELFSTDVGKRAYEILSATITYARDNGGTSGIVGKQLLAAFS